MKKQAPQKSVDEFWDKFNTKHPGKAFTILPNNLYAKRAAANAPKGVIPGQNAVQSYEGAAAACKVKVRKIVKECKRINQKYRDPHFDIEADFKRSQWNPEVPPDCLTSLDEDKTELRPQSVKRVEDVFDQPQFFKDGATASDVRQGNDGDCWLMSALSTLSNKEGLIQKICVDRDEQVGVYGFVFHRDGEWISEVIDDKLYLIKEDFDEATLDRYQFLELQNRKNPDEEYQKINQTGSRALYFAQCSDPNETWLPLLEKAYAKAHGDYSAIEGGFVGEGLEDLTGGVTTEVFATDILDKEKFWYDELMRVNKEFLFGCGQMGGIYGERKGIMEKHAYSIMEAREIDGQRLLKLRNPWGNTEWKGPWSDGSEQWTPAWMEKLNHRFGDDGLFWISYKDLLRNFGHLDRTRLFSDEWTVNQQWTSVNVPWSVDYLDTKFTITLTKDSPVVIVLSQLDDRYYLGLEGQYDFHLQFRLHKDDEEDYIVRSNGTYFMKRSASTELDLEAGHYTVLLKIRATRLDRPTVEEVIRRTCCERREKLLSTGLSYDLAHAKGQFRELEREKREREKKEAKAKRHQLAKKAHEQRRKAHKREKEKQKIKKAKIEAKTARKINGRPGPSPELEQKLKDLSVADDDGGLGISGFEENTTGAEKAVRDSLEEERPASSPMPSQTHSRNASQNGRITPSSGGFQGRGGYNQGRGGYNEGRDGYNDRIEGLQGRGGYNDSQESLTGGTGSDRLPLRRSNPSEGYTGRGGYNQGRDGYNGRGGYNESQETEDSQPGTAASTTGKVSKGHSDGFTGRGGYNQGRDGYNGRGGYNEDIDSRPGTPKMRPVSPGQSRSRQRSPAPDRPIRRETSPSPAPSRRATLSTGRHKGKIPGITIDGTSIRTHRGSVSSSSSESMSWDSELDYESSDSDSCASSHGEGKRAFLQGFYQGVNAGNENEEDDDDEFARDPWNAVCVVGLRVWSKDNNVAINVVRPDGKVRDEEGKGLDVDDSAKDATVISPSEAGRNGFASLKGRMAEVRSGSEVANVEKDRSG